MDKSESKRLADSFLEFSKLNPENNIEVQVPEAYALYNYLPFVDVLLDSTEKVEKVSNTKLYPSYAFARIYKNNHDLPAHKDIDACEISITLNLNCDEVWDIWFAENEKGSTDKAYRQYISLNPGDAVLYLGNEIYHGRETFEGFYCNQLFLHWVQRNGRYTENLFDRARLMNDMCLHSQILKNYALNVN